MKKVSSMPARSRRPVILEEYIELKEILKVSCNFLCIKALLDSFASRT